MIHNYAKTLAITTKLSFWAKSKGTLDIRQTIYMLCPKSKVKIKVRISWGKNSLSHTNPQKKDVGSSNFSKLRHCEEPPEQRSLTHALWHGRSDSSCSVKKFAVFSLRTSLTLFLIFFLTHIFQYLFQK